MSINIITALSRRANLSRGDEIIIVHRGNGKYLSEERYSFGEIYSSDVLIVTRGNSEYYINIDHIVFIRIPIVVPPALAVTTSDYQLPTGES